MGIEPTCSAWKADVLPLNYIRISARAAGLEPTPLAASPSLAGLRFPRPTYRQCDADTSPAALPIELRPRMPPKGLCERRYLPPVFPGCQVTKYSINGGFRSHWIFARPRSCAVWGVSGRRAAHDIRRRHEKRTICIRPRRLVHRCGLYIPAPRQQGG